MQRATLHLQLSDVYIASGIPANYILLYFKNKIIEIIVFLLGLDTFCTQQCIDVQKTLRKILILK